MPQYDIEMTSDPLDIIPFENIISGATKPQTDFVAATAALLRYVQILQESIEEIATAVRKHRNTYSGEVAAGHAELYEAVLGPDWYNS